MDPELLYSKFYQAFSNHNFLEAKEIIYQAHREGMPAGHILVKLVNRTLDQLQRLHASKSSAVAQTVQIDYAKASHAYFDCLVKATRPKAQKLLDQWVNDQVPAPDIMLKIITPAMEEIGVLQARYEISLSQIFMASKIVEDAMAVLTPLLPTRKEAAGKIIIGNAFGDHHALGRKIVATFLRSYGFEVVDLGLSVSNEKFIEKALQEQARLICVSALLLHTAQEITSLRRQLDERGLGYIKILAGGAPFNMDNQLYKRLGCDATASDGLQAVKVAKQLLGTS